MTTQCELHTATAETVTRRSVSPIDEDNALEETSDSVDSSAPAEQVSAHRPKPSAASAVSPLSKNSVALVVCDRDLLPAKWREALEETGTPPDPPLLIVTSRLADESLRAGAINRGAHDVLAKSLDVEEVVRVLGFAWRHWKDNLQIRQRTWEDEANGVSAPVPDKSPAEPGGIQSRTVRQFLSDERDAARRRDPKASSREMAWVGRRRSQR